MRSAGWLRRSDRIRIDPSVVRGLEYYTGPVYEVELLLETKDEKGRPVRFGSVGGGGRYDGLVSRFRGEPVPATGFSIGVSRLAAALALVNKNDTQPNFGPVVVTVFDPDRIADYQRMVAELRAANIRAELYLGSGKFNPQMKYADKRNAPCVIIQGSDEYKNGGADEEVVVKDLVLGAQLSKLEKGRDEYLQKQADAQRKVPRDQLVKTVQEILAATACGRGGVASPLARITSPLAGRSPAEGRREGVSCTHRACSLPPPQPSPARGRERTECATTARFKSSAAHPLPAPAAHARSAW